MSDTKEIQLTKGKITIVDADMYDRLMRQKWYAQGPDKQGTWYAVCNYGPPRYGKGGIAGIFLSMHRVIMGTPEGMETDHRNHDGLDNRRCNLRICTKSQNQMNKRPSKGCASAFKGVTWYQGKWSANIRVKGKMKYLGRYASELKAAQAYNEAATEYFGEFACLNRFYTDAIAAVF